MFKHRTILKTAAIIVGAAALLATGGVALAASTPSKAHARYTTDPLYLDGARTVAITVYSDDTVTAQLHEVGGGKGDTTARVHAATIDLDGTRYLVATTASIALADTGLRLRGYDLVLPSAISQPNAEHHGCAWTYGQAWLEPGDAPHLAGGEIVSGYCIDQGRADAVVHTEESRG